MSEKEEKNKAEFLDPADMAQISAAKSKVALAVSEAEKTSANAKIADLEYRVLVQHIFLKYGMSVNDRIEDNNGQIIRVPVSEDEEKAE